MTKFLRYDELNQACKLDTIFYAFQVKHKTSSVIAKMQTVTPIVDGNSNYDKINILKMFGQNLGSL